jgi:HAD superfamily hydrolase (TIGR01484 family)
MRYHALATDYDGTIAIAGAVDESTLNALRRLKDSGRKLLLVTGRELPDLARVFPHRKLFDRIVAENGALLHRPETDEKKALGKAPPRAFAELLRQRGVSPVSVGQVIVATTEPNETAVLTAIRDLGLELQVIFNKGAVMVLPSGVNKATGLSVALRELGLSSHNAVGIGDAENDHAFLDSCECSAAVANALPSLKEKADSVTARDHGAGVSELIDQLIATDLREVAPRLTRHELLLGLADDQEEVRADPH